MGKKISKELDILAAWCGLIWIVLNIDACFTWFFIWNIRYFLGTIIILYASFYLSRNDGLILSRQKLQLLVPLLILSAYMLFFKYSFFSLFKYIPLMCVVCWRTSALNELYIYFRRFVIFYSILGIFVELLVLSGIWISLPHTILSPQDAVQEGSFTQNYFFGLFCIPSSDVFLNFYRACGPLREGGHWAVFVGFVYFVESAIYKKRNIWLIVGGLLTLSPNILLFFVLTELYNGISRMQLLKPLLIFSIFFMGVMSAYLYLPKTIQDQVYYIIFERTLENTIETAGTDGFLGMLDTRTDEIGRFSYQKFLNSGLTTQLTGFDSFSVDFVMSDYRYLLMQFGYIGTFLLIWNTYRFTLVRGRQSLYGFCLLLMALIVFVQRSWMFSQVYIWTMMLFALNENQTYENDIKQCRITNCH